MNSEQGEAIEGEGRAILGEACFTIGAGLGYPRLEWTRRGTEPPGFRVPLPDGASGVAVVSAEYYEGRFPPRSERVAPGWLLTATTATAQSPETLARQGSSEARAGDS